MQCIFCRLEKTESLEHVFPLAIGGALTTRRVCGDCNSWLGDHVDCQLINHLFVVLRRAELKLVGNSGRIPDALRALMPDATLASDPTQRVRVSTKLDGTLDVFLVYNETVRDAGGVRERTVRLDPREADKIPVIIERERARAGLPKLSPEKLAVEVGNAVLQQAPDSTLHGKPRIDLLAYQLGVLKIAYELAHHWLGDAWLADAMAGEIADVIWGRKEFTSANIRGQVQFGVRTPMVLWPQDRHSHVAFCSRQGDNIAINLRIFDAFSGVIFVSHNAEAYTLADGLEHGPFLRIDPIARALTESSFLDEVARLQPRWDETNT